jgi:type VI secretion system protein ImpA
MSIEAEFTELDRPVSADHPCGQDLEDTQLLASFDTFRLFGQLVPLPPETDWREIKVKSLEALQKSKDLRLLGHFAAAALRIDGWTGFFGSVGVAARWIKTYWADLYPHVDEDAILRKNALNCLSDLMAVLDGLRRTPIVKNQQLGPISLRDVDLATGELAPTGKDTAPANAAQVAAVFAAAKLEELRDLKACVETGTADLKAIDAAMVAFGGVQASPDFDPLFKVLVRVDKLLGDQLIARGAAQAANPGVEAGVSDAPGSQPTAVGAIKSRQDALRALDAVALFFRQTEPSSPIPMFLERAKRLIGKDFLEILADVAPDGLATARSVGGLLE